MKKEISTYIASQNIAVLAIALTDGTPHAAALGFAHTDEPFQFFFETPASSLKAQSIAQGPVSAALVIGTDPSHMVTFQARGTVTVAALKDQQHVDEVFFTKFPGKIKNREKEPQLYCMFTPTWWRFTDWTTPNGKEVTLSTD